jgi:hypothetical protein
MLLVSGEFGWRMALSANKEKYMNTLAPLFIVLAMLIVTVVLPKIGGVLGLPGFMPLKNGKAGSPEHGAS